MGSQLKLADKIRLQRKINTSESVAAWEKRLIKALTHLNTPTQTPASIEIDPDGPVSMADRIRLSRAGGNRPDGSGTPNTGAGEWHGEQDLIAGINKLLQATESQYSQLSEKSGEMVAADLKARQIDKSVYQKQKDSVANELKAIFENEALNLEGIDFSKISSKQFKAFVDRFENDDEKYLFYEYAYWTGAKSSLCSDLRKKLGRPASKRLHFQYNCAICHQSGSYSLGRGFEAYIKGPCHHCGHVSRLNSYHETPCSCQFCEPIDRSMAELMVTLKVELENLIEPHIEDIKEAFLQKHAVSDPPSQTTMMLDFEREQFRLNSDERYFLQTVEKIKTFDPSIDAKHIFDHMAFKKSNQDVWSDLCDHKVFYKTVNFPVFNTDTVMRKVARSIFLDYHGYNRFPWSSSKWERFDPAINYQKIHFRFLDVKTVLPSPTADYLARNETIVFNPFFFAPPEISGMNSTTADESRHTLNLFKSPHEAEWFKQLKIRHQGMLIMPNYPVRLFVDLAKLKGEFSKEELGYFSRAYVDFAVYSEDGDISKIYEVQISRAHNNKVQIQRDNLKKRLFELCNIEFQEVHGNYSPSYIE